MCAEQARKSSELQTKAAASAQHKLARAASAEAARIETLRVAAAGKITEGESSDAIVFIPPPPTARELAALAKLSKVKTPKAPVTGIPSAEDVAALKATVAQKELLKEYALLQRRDAALSSGVVGAPFDPFPAAAASGGWYPTR